MNIFDFSFAPIATAIIAYAILVSGILFLNEKNNFTTFFLWTILDTIIVVGLYKSGANANLALTFTIGTSITALCLLIKKQVAWTDTDTKTAVLAGVCLAIYFFATPLIAVVAASFAIFIAGTPYYRFLKENKISRRICWANVLFFLSSLISLILVINGSEIEIIFPLMCTIYWLIGGFLSFKSVGRA